MGDIFNINVDLINNNSSMDNIENWDSLKHMNLLVSLEEEFDIEFDVEDIERLASFQAIYKYIYNYLDK